MSGPDKPAGAWSFLSSAVALWGACISIVTIMVTVVGGYYSLSSEAADNHAAIVSMLPLISRVQTLEDDRVNDVANEAGQIQGLQAQLQGVQSALKDINISLNSIQQSQATAQAQVQFLINQAYPGVKVGK
jgi:hypothetical protein